MTTAKLLRSLDAAEAGTDLLGRWRKLIRFDVPKSSDTINGWRDWSARTRAAMPVRYFLGDTLPGLFSLQLARLDRAWWWLKHRLQPRHRYHKLDLRRGDPSREYHAGWLDSDTQIEFAIGAIVRNYVERELRHSLAVQGEPEDEARRIYAELFTHIPAAKTELEQEYDLVMGGCDLGDLMTDDQSKFVLAWHDREEELKKRTREVLKAAIDASPGWWT